jgi:hypothetical protein
MASWNDTQNIALGDVVSTTQWNNIFGPNQSMQYIKNRADFLLVDYYYKYVGNPYILTAGWPQGDSTDFAAMGDVYYPIWILNGVTTNDKYITLNGPAKYLCVVQCDVVSDQQDYRNNNSVLRLMVNDTGGYTNFSTTNLNKGIGSAITGTLSPFKYSIPFALDAKFTTDLVLGFAAVQNYENIYTASAQYGPVNFRITPSIMIYKIPMYMEQVTVTTSFVIDTSTLSGTSNF